MSTSLQRRSLLVVSLLLGASLLIGAATPSPAPALPVPDLAALLPRQFGSWQTVELAQQQVSSRTDAAAGGVSPYDREVARSYRDAQGREVMLTLAYALHQQAATRIHEPVECYPAAGFQLLDYAPATVSLPAPIEGRRMLAQRGNRLESVLYWVRIGPLYGPGGLQLRWHLAGEQLRGERSDGMLVRASMLVLRPEDAAAAQARLEAFLVELLAASPAALRPLLQR